METKSFKASIMNAMDALTVDQIDQVLNFINHLRKSDIENDHATISRQNAMDQIRDALRSDPQQPQRVEYHMI